jgi:hypothetical protein
MSEQIVDLAETVERRPIKHLGVFRTIVTPEGVSRDITIAECRLDGGVLRTLWRRDHSQGCREGVPEGVLASYVKHKIADPDWQACMSRLLDWKMIRIIPAYFGDARRIALTESGKGWAAQLCGERQLAGKPVDGIEE